MLDGVQLPDFLDVSKQGTTDELLFVYRKLSSVQRELRNAEKEVLQVRARLEVTQRQVPESQEFREELMHAYRKMSQAQDAEIGVKKALQRSEAMNTTFRDQVDAQQRQLDSLKLLVLEKDDLISHHGSQMGILRKETDSLHRTLLRREDEAKSLSAKLGAISQDKDAITRIKSALESDIATLKSTIKAKDATIAELQRSKVELQKKLESARHRAERQASIPLLTTPTAPTATPTTQQKENPSIANQVLSFIGLSSKPVPTPSNPPQHSHFTSTNNSTDPSSADEYSTDPSYRSYSTDNGEIFKLTEDGSSMSPNATGDASTSPNMNVGRASLKMGELQRRTNAADSARASTTASQPILLSSPNTSQFRKATSLDLGSGPPLPKKSEAITFTFTTTFSSLSPNSRPTHSDTHLTSKDASNERIDAASTALKSSQNFISSSSSTSLASMHPESPLLSPSGSCSSLPSLSGAGSPCASEMSSSSEVAAPLVFDAAAEARLLEIQKRLDDSSTMWNLSASNDRLSRKKGVQLPTKVSALIQPSVKSKSHRIAAACVDPGGVKLVAGGETPLCMYDAQSGGAALKMLKSSPKSITSVCYDESGTLLLASSMDRTARVWFPTSSTPCTINHASEVYCAVFCGSSHSPTNFRASFSGISPSQLASNSERAITNTAPPGSGHLSFPSGASSSMSSIPSLPTHIKIATICRNRTLSIWDISSSTSYKFTFSHAFKSLSYAMCANPISSLVYTGHLDKHVRIFDAKKGDVIAQFDTQHTDCITGIQLSPDASKIYTTSRDGTIACHDTASGNKRLATLSAPNLSIDSNWARASLSSSGDHIALGSANGNVFIWDTNSTKLVATLNASSTAVSGVVWNPVNYNNLVTFDDHGVISIWS